MASDGSVTSVIKALSERVIDESDDDRAGEENERQSQERQPEEIVPPRELRIHQRTSGSKAMATKRSAR
jgi:hypothetical protein